MSMLVSLLRHASTQWNEQRRMQGRRDIPLSDSGREQVRQWRSPDADGAALQWVSSPLVRALETARLLSGVEPRREDALVEMDWGDWEGLTFAQIHARDGDTFVHMQSRGMDFRPPQGESLRDVQLRALDWLRQCARSGGAPVVAVTHKSVLRVVMAAATGWDMLGKPPIRLRDGALHRFTIDDGGGVSVLACNIALCPQADAKASNAIRQ